MVVAEEKEKNPIFALLLAKIFNSFNRIQFTQVGFQSSNPTADLQPLHQSLDLRRLVGV